MSFSTAKKFCALTLLLMSNTSFALQDQHIAIPMETSRAHTYYVEGKFSDLLKTHFLVDTGSGYTTINHETLKKLQANNQATYVRDLIGILANGKKMRVPIYRISSLILGDDCELQNIEAAVFPGKTRQILGLNTLRKAGSFVFTFKPATLVLSQCGKA